MKGLNWFAILGAFVLGMANQCLIDPVLQTISEEWVGPAIRIGRFYHPTLLSLVLRSVAAIAVNIVCGYLVTAWVGHRKMSHAWALSWVNFLFNLVGSSVWMIVIYPSWYMKAMLCAPFFCLLGGWLRLQTRGLQNTVN